MFLVKFLKKKKTREPMEPREQAIKQLKSLTNAKEILPVRVLD